MQWAKEAGRWWRKPPGFSSIITDYAEVERLRLGGSVLRLLRGQTAQLVVARPEQGGPGEPFVAQSAEEATSLAADLTEDISTLHRNGIRLGLRSCLTGGADRMPRLVVADGTGGAALACEQLDEMTDGVSPEPIDAKWTPRLGCWPCGRASWQRTFIDTIRQADRTAIPDWHAALRLIFFHLTAARLGKDDRADAHLIGHARRTERKLAPGLWSAVRTAFATRDADILHWGLGLRSGYRGWLKRLDKQQPLATSG